MRAVSAAALLAGTPALGHAAEIDLLVRADQPGDTISRFLYGHFAEHLGRGIYEGVWVDAVAPGELAVAPGEGGFTETLNVGRNA
jgi:hypothetical protein